MVRAAPFLIIIMLEIFCLIDVIVSDDDRVRHLPKIAWFLLILFFPLVGSAVWLIAGRPTNTVNRGRSPYEREASAFPEYDRPGRAAGLTPESDEEFLRKIRERAEEQRQRAAEQKKAEEQRNQAEREDDGTA